MSTAPGQSRWSTTDRFDVIHVSSTDNPPSALHGRTYDTGTYALVTRYPESFNGLLRLREAFTEAYGTPMVSGTRIGPANADGQHTAFRWSWERLTTWGGRVSDTIWVSVKTWS